MNSRDLLIEIGTEELPPKALKSLSEAFTASIAEQLGNDGLPFEAISSYASPRRLAVVVSGLAEQGADKAVEKWGPPVKVAFKDEQPTRAAEAFAAANGLNLTELKNFIANDGKQDKLCYREVAKGVAVVAILQRLVENALSALPIPKRMRWGASRSEFVRPIHWVVLLFGDETRAENIMGITAGNTTRGHRFHSNRELPLSSPASYAEVLEKEGWVVADFARRQAMIKQQVEAAGAALGGKAVIDADLLDEVTALVEWPVALSGSFEQRFLSVPAEALISSMKEHQKYFHTVDANGNLMPNFITVSNIESSDPQKVIAGNEKVIRPRLSDAAFFFETDRKTSLLQQREKLRSIVFQDKLGTLFDKTERVAVLAESIARLLGANIQNAVRAAQLCKSDLVTEMVGEFDDMQGIAGYYYAQNDGEDPGVALAMNEQYMPRFASDGLPTTDIGSVLALADRLDTITGIFGIGQLPSGSKDPFALRRASLAVLRLIVEKQLNLDLHPLVEQALQQHPQVTTTPALVEQILGYILERLKAWYEDQGISAEVFQAVSAKGLTAPSDIDARVRAVQHFASLPEAEALAAANKRVYNILAKAETVPAQLDQSLLQEPAEQALAKALAEHQQRVEPLLEAHSYTEVLQVLAGLQPTVDTFFDQVMVNADDPALRNNRLALLNHLQALFLHVADISKLVTKN